MKYKEYVLKIPADCIDDEIMAIWHLAGKIKNLSQEEIQNLTENDIVRIIKTKIDQ